MSELPLLKKLYDYSLIRGVFVLLSRRVGREFGFPEALVYARAVDFFYRYQAIVSKLEDDGTAVLDVGSGKIGVGAFLRNRNVISLDIDPVVVQTAFGKGVVSPADDLPFKDRAIGNVISADCLEHLQRGSRAAMVNEMKRVARNVVLLHTPIQDSCRATDVRFAETHRKLFGGYDKIHQQHIIYGQPKMAEVLSYFGGDVEVYPDQNCHTNYILFILQRLPIFGWLTGLLFLFLLKRLYHKPPYYAALFVWRVKH